MRLAVVVVAAGVACGEGDKPSGITTVQSALDTTVLVTVVDGGGVPQAGADVGAFLNNGSIWTNAIANASGQATFTLPANSYRFAIQELGIEFYSGAVGHCATPACTSATITITRVDVLVVDASGAPRAGLEVVWETPAGDVDGYTDTGADGHARVPTPPGSYLFFTNVNGVDYMSGAAGHCVVPGCASTTITVPGPVTVTVTDTAGAPAVGYPVVWMNAAGGAGPSVDTNASGVATLFPPLEPVRFRANVDGTQFFSGSSVHCNQPGCTSATISVPQQTEVTVVNGAGNAISGRSVAAFLGNATTATINRSTNPIGKATFRLLPGNYRFRATCPSTNEQFFSGNVGHCFMPGGCSTAKITMPCGVCVGQPANALCEDANPCTTTARCQDQRCVAETWVSCSASDQCHNAGACSAETGAAVCSNPPKPNDTSCNDGNACTQTDSCQAGACVGGSPVVCSASDQCHVAGTCDPGTGVCSNPAKENGTSCNDGNACTQTDSCQVGACVGANPITCAAQDQCHVAGTCNPATGVCSVSPAATDGTACSDGNRCSVSDSCQAGTCLPGPATGCAAGQAHYVSVIDLGSEQFGSFATGINNSGVVVGSDAPNGGIYQLGYPGTKGFRWSESGGKVYLPWAGAQSYAVDINDAGVMSVTAGVEPWAMLPCRYDPAVDAQPVCQNHAGTAYGINATGMLTGGSYYPDGIVSIFRLGTGAIEILPHIPGVDAIAKGVAIADDGSLVGNQRQIDVWLGVRYTAARGMEWLVDLLPAGSGWSSLNPSSIRAGQIIGWGMHGGHGRAFRMRTAANGDVTDIVVLPVPSTFPPDTTNVTIAAEGNASGEIVGSVYDGLPYWPQAAFVYTDVTGSVDLNTLIDPQSGWQLAAAFAINDNHQVVGYGFHDGANRAFKLTLPDLSPCPAPANSCRLPGVRDLLTGVCSNPAKPDGTACDDGVQCTQSETCVAGSCQDTNDFPTVVNLPVQDLGSLGLIQSFARDINSSGTVVGWSSTDNGQNHAWMFTGSGPLVSLAELGFGTPSSAEAINDSHTVVGFQTQENGSHAYRYGASGVEDFGIVGDGSAVLNNERVLHAGEWVRGAFPTDINEAGEFVGFFTMAGKFRGFRANGAGVMDVGTLVADGTTAMDGISENGSAVGSSTTGADPASESHAVLYESDIVGIRDLNTYIDPLSGWTLATASARSGDFVVGTGYRDGDGVARAYRLHLSTGVVDDLSHGWESSSARRVNAAGDVVGTGYLDASDHAISLSSAFVYTDLLGFKNLNDLVPNASWNMMDARAITAAGEIVGWGYHASEQGPRPFRIKLPSGQSATCQARNTCGGGEAVCLFADGYVQKPDGTFVAVFGYDSSATSSFQPAVNEVRINGAVVTNPQPAPPVSLSPGTHVGAYLPAFSASQTVSWTVDGQTVTMSASDPSKRLPTVPIGSSGYGVAIGGVPITIEPDLGTWAQPPPLTGPQQEPEPTGQAFTGVLVGKLDVSPTGAATYTVPISLPPGIAGIAPNLSLVYSSQGGPGIAGQGWELTGLSMIHRCPKTRIQDGAARPVKMDSLVNATDPGNVDGICLDGQRLFEDPLGSGQYRLERMDFSEIVRDLGTGTFTVKVKSGEIRRYGSSGQTRVPLASAGLPGQPATEAAVWALDRVTDVWGNYFDVHYNDDNADFSDRGLVVTSIAYTGNLPTGTSPFHTITFQYEDRPDIRHARFGQAVLRRKKRLTGITTPQGIYTLAFMPDDDPMLPSRLHSIDYCTGATCPSCAGATCPVPLVFDWDGGGFDFVEDPAYAPPRVMAVRRRQGSTMQPLAWAGTQFADLDGDGRLDFVSAMNGDRHAWRNTGQGWDETNFPPPPADLANELNDRANTLFVDIDGDGILDMVQGYVSITQPGAVWLNRIKHGQGWQLRGPMPWPVNFNGDHLMADMNGDGLADLVNRDTLEVLQNTGTGWEPPSLNYFHPMTLGLHWSRQLFQIEDFNQDGLPDLVMRPLDDEDDEDLGDLLAAAVGVLAESFPEQPPTTKTIVIPNTGANGPNGTVWGPAYGIDDPTGRTKDGTRLVGDLDGDGLGDALKFRVHLTPSGGLTTTITSEAAAYLGTGSGYTQLQAIGYHGALGPFIPLATTVDFGSAAMEAELKKYRFAMTDLNKDGLVDFILRHPDGSGGQVLINTGTSFRDLNGAANRQQVTSAKKVPEVLPSGKFDFSEGSAFVDLNGDGVPDLIQGERTQNLIAPFETETVRRAWLNTFRPPVIRKFPAGLAPRSEVTYTVITTHDAEGTYSYEPPTPETGTKLFATPLQVVQVVRAADGTATGPLFATAYQYESLRASRHNRGPQGFAKVTAIDQREGSNFAGWVRTETRFSQVYPYTGMPTEVTRTAGNLKLAYTTTSYCNTIMEDEGGNANCTSGTFPPRTSMFVYPRSVTDSSYLHRDDVPQSTPNDVMRTRMDYRYDAAGNSLMTTVTIDSLDGVCDPDPESEQRCPRHEKTIVNSYDANGGPVSTADLTRLGKPTLTTVQTRSVVPAGSTRTHTTEFKYATLVDGAIAMTKKVVEPGTAAAGEPTELHTAYGYDAFGNVTNTTECASAFEFCFPTAYPNSSHPGHRRTAVSYDPADFSPPPGGVVTTLSAALNGRFPTRTVNPAGHIEYTAYDPIRGVLRQKTGPNGIHTCFEYDDLGRETRAIERCGVTGKELTTITDRFYATGSDPARAKVMIRTRAPNGVASWSYTDALGRATATRGRSFEGGFTESYTYYDLWGRTARQAGPYVIGQPAFETETAYDNLGRVRTVARTLGIIDGTGVSRKSIQTTKYYARKVRTEHNLNGEDEAHLHEQPREETKNLLGKVESVLADGQLIKYSYDADGNLTETLDPRGNKVQIGYDTRGRKTSADDPDLGTWRYIYDGFGDLLIQRDAKSPSTGEETTMTYDALGRVTSKTDTTGTARWVYDVAPGAGKGKLAAMVSSPDARLQGPCPAPYQLPTDGNRAVRSLSYDELGQLVSTTECADGQQFVVNHAYDGLGREQQITYPMAGTTRLAVQYAYTSLGFLRYVADAATGNVYWAAKEMNALGHVTREQTGNGVETVSTRNPSTGWLLGSESVAHANSDTLIRRWTADFDEVGNLRHRFRDDPGSGSPSEETFTYDALNRLRTSRVQIAGVYDTTETYLIDILGNLENKAGVPYTYGAAGGCTTGGPHAVCTVNAGAQFQYDPNGNMLSGNGRTVQYNPANKPIEISNSGSTAKFMYGADGHRVVQEVTSGGSIARTVYVGLGGTGKSFYERTNKDGAVEHTHFLYAGGAHGGNAFAVKVLSDQATVPPRTSYYHVDHLGSVTAISDDRGRATLLGYDPWGARREPDGRPGDPGTFQLQVGHREFTGHETIPGVGLVNMNGRVYDPALGRFLSADPTVQFVADLQSYNRYTYVLNNPLRYSDPTGYGIVGALLSQDSSTFINIGLAYTAVMVCGPAAPGCYYAISYATAVYNMGVMTYNGASFEQAVTVSIIGFGSGLAGGAIASPLGKTAGAAMVSGAVSGAISATMTTVAYGGDLGQNVFKAAVQGAAFSAATWSFQQYVALTRAAAAAAQGDALFRRAVEQATRTDGGISGSQALDAELRAHPLLTQPNNAGERGISPYWISKLQPFFNEFGFDLRSLRVQFAVLGDGEVGMSNYRVNPRMVNLSVHIYGMMQWELSTMLHEAMHLVQGDIYGGSYGVSRNASDIARFGPSEDAQYNVKNYPELGFLSYSEISIGGGGSYPVEAGFNRFSDSVIVGNLYKCGGVCK